jgi:hypothetical protein
MSDWSLIALLGGGAIVLCFIAFWLLRKVEAYTPAEKDEAIQKVRTASMAYKDTRIIGLNGWEREWIRGATKHAISLINTVPNGASATTFVQLEELMHKMTDGYIPKLHIYGAPDEKGTDPDRVHPHPDASKGERYSVGLRAGRDDDMPPEPN